MTMSTDLRQSGVVLALQETANVMRAVILRDIKTRFFDHGLGFLIVPLWPLVHMIVLLLIYHYGGRRSPYGESLNIFFATGLIPTLLFMYISRFMAISLMNNKPLLTFPVVKMVDIMIGRAFLEAVGGVLTLAMLLTILWLSGDNPWPYDLKEAVLAYLATLLLAIGVGSIVGVLTMVSHFVLIAYAIILIGLYISSGTLFVAANLPDQIAIPLSWNPVVQAVEWMRTAYFETYPDRLLDRAYLVEFGLSCLFLGLFLERVLRRRMFE